MKELLLNLIKRILFNSKPSRFIYDISRQYVNYYRGDQNGNIETNGELRFLKSLNLNESNILFDVGANVGEYSKYLPKKNLHCFEPNKKVYEKLKENYPYVKTNNIALSNEIGNMTFYINERFNAASSPYYIPELADSKLTKTTVKTDTIDNYCESNNISHIDLLKIDVEGHELFVLKGAKRMLEDGKIKNIQFEFGWASIYARTFLKDYFDLLEPLGYKIYKLKPDNNEEIKWTPEEEGISYANFIAIR